MVSCSVEHAIGEDDDLTDDLRQMIEAAPLTTLRESRFVRRGQLYVIHPGLLGDLNGR